MFNDLREYIKEVEAINECKVVRGADWDLEIGLITELCVRSPNPPLLLFDDISGYPAGFRVATLPSGSLKRAALTLGFPLNEFNNWNELVKAWRDKIRGGVTLVPPVEIDTGPIKENIRVGDDVDLFMFPTPKWSKLDGGRYIGTGHMVLQRDPDEGWVNIGTYRTQIHDKSTATIHITPGHHVSHPEPCKPKGF